MLIISVTSGVVLCLIILVVRLIFIRRKSDDANSEQGKPGGQFKTSNTGETTITNGFSADDISEIDADIDLTTPLPMSTNPNITRNDVSRNIRKHLLEILENPLGITQIPSNYYKKAFLKIFWIRILSIRYLKCFMFYLISCCCDFHNRITTPIHRRQVLMATWALQTYHIRQQLSWCPNPHP